VALQAEPRNIPVSCDSFHKDLWGDYKVLASVCFAGIPLTMWSVSEGRRLSLWTLCVLLCGITQGIPYNVNMSDPLCFPHLGWNHSWFIHKSSLVVTSRETPDDDGHYHHVDGVRICLWIAAPTAYCSSLSMENHGGIVSTRENSWVVHLSAIRQPYQQSSSSKSGGNLAKEMMNLALAMGPMALFPLQRKACCIFYYPEKSINFARFELVNLWVQWQAS
jgi:hypothetical protein